MNSVIREYTEQPFEDVRLKIAEKWTGVVLLGLLLGFVASLVAIFHG